MSGVTVWSGESAVTPVVQSGPDKRPPRSSGARRAGGENSDLETYPGITSYREASMPSRQASLARADGAADQDRGIEGGKIVKGHQTGDSGRRMETGYLRQTAGLIRNRDARCVYGLCHEC